MLDFTPTTYQHLLETFLKAEYHFISAEEYFSNSFSHPFAPLIILRHDIDKCPQNSLIIAKIEASLGIRSTYFFRVQNVHTDIDILKAIVELNHHIGYHYEDFSAANGDNEKSITSFVRNLNYLKQYFPVQTIAMHGAPRSKFNNLDLWRHYDYRQFGLHEIYLDINYNDVFYLTDTGMCWDGYRFSLRDKIPQQAGWRAQGRTYHSTFDIINAISQKNFPTQCLINTHPQRWNDSTIRWTYERISQYIKNLAKMMLTR